MSFQHPELLFGLLAILIPVLIHLFNFRRYRKLMFSNIEFLKNITVQTRKQNKLKHLLVLLTRILAIVFLVIAFAGPQLKKTELDAGSLVLSAIYIDNSFSMMAEGESGRLFDQAVNLGREIILQSPRDGRFTLINNETSLTGRISTREAALSSLDDLTVSPSIRNLSSVVSSARRTATEKEYDAMDIFLLSDFQRYTSDFDKIPADSMSRFFLLPMQHAQNRNIFVDSCWTEQPLMLPGKPVPFTIRIRNASERDVEKIPLKVSLNGQQKAVAGVDIGAGSFVDETISLTPTSPGWQSGLIEIEDYPITFDDQYYFTFPVSRSIRVLEISDNETNRVLEQFYQSDSVFDYNRVNYTRINYNNLNNYNLIVLNALPSITSGLSNQLIAYLEQGGNMLFIPNFSGSFEDDNNLLRKLQAGRITGTDTAYTRVIGIKRDHELFGEAISEIPENASLPDIQKHFRVSYSVGSGLESLFTLLNGNDILLTKNVGNGRFFLLATTLEKEAGNLTTNPIFVPFVYGAAIGSGLSAQLAHTIGKDELIESFVSVSYPSENPFSLLNKETAYAFIPEQKFVRGNLLINVRDGIELAGLYDLVLNDSLFRTFAFNYERKESTLDFLDRDELINGLESSGITQFEVVDAGSQATSEVLDAMQKESELWKLFIIFALSMLLAEVLILRLWR
jgi:hypothetical protein